MKSRTEREMMDLILGYAQRDENIRAVILNGSRANPAAKKDPFQDYDVVYLVRDDTHLRGNIDFIEQFGEILILQLPDEGKILPPSDTGSYCYLTQFADGNRIDLTIQRIDEVGDLKGDSLTQILIDKDRVLPALAAPDESSYMIEQPSRTRYEGCCNEFWWVSVYVAKGLWRGEFIYAREVMDKYVRDMFILMLQWYFGTETDFRVSPGKGCKNIEPYIDAQLWSTVLRTYANGTPDEAWSALSEMQRGFRTMATGVGAHFGFTYNQVEDDNVCRYIEHIKELPRNADAIFS